MNPKPRMLKVDFIWLMSRITCGTAAHIVFTKNIKIQTVIQASNG